MQSDRGSHAVSSGGVASAASVIYVACMTLDPALIEERRSDALLVLRGAAQLPVGRDRIAMLEAVADQGSITAAAKTLGYSCKTVWDGLNASTACCLGQRC